MGFLDRIKGLFEAGQPDSKSVSVSSSAKKSISHSVRVTDNFAEQYQNFCCVYKTCSPEKYSPISEEAYDAAKHAYHLLEKIDKDKFDAKIMSESRKNDLRYMQHPVLGFIWTDSSNYEWTMKKLRERIDYCSKVLAGRGKFMSIYDSLTVAKVLIANEKRKRNFMADMPDYRYYGISKKFNEEKMRVFIAVDTETTGLSASGHIVQLSAVRFENFEPVSVWNTYLKPGSSRLPKEATEVNGITDEMLADKPLAGNVASSFEEFIGAYPIVGYNLDFDMKFLWRDGIDVFKKKRRYYDALDIARKVYKDEPDSFKLEDVAENIGIYFPAHNSAYDALATGLVFAQEVNDCKYRVKI